MQAMSHMNDCVRALHLGCLVVAGGRSYFHCGFACLRVGPQGPCNAALTARAIPMRVSAGMAFPPDVAVW